MADYQHQSVYFPTELLETLREEAQEDDKSLSAYLEKVILSGRENLNLKKVAYQPMRRHRPGGGRKKYEVIIERKVLKRREDQKAG